MNRDLHDIEKGTGIFNVHHGSIWRVPVTYGLKFPPVFVDPLISKRYSGEDAHKYWSEQGVYKRAIDEAEIVDKAGVHPFLVLQKPNMFLKLREMRAFSWHKDSIFGVMLSTFSNLEHGQIKIDPIRFKEKNDYKFFHFLRADNLTKLDKDSYVALNVVSRVHIKYFTDKIGKLSDNDYLAISQKIKKLF